MVWETFNLSKEARISPSEMLGVDREEEPWVAYCLDRAVTTFGTAVQGELDAVEGKNKKEIEVKRQRVLNRFFPEGARYQSPGKR
jgi:hypothetical protein